METRIDDPEFDGSEEEEEEEEEEGNFASDFYRSGTDWSCLLLPDQTTSKSNGDDSGAALAADDNHHQGPGVKNHQRTTPKLKQTNLFHFWGGGSRQPSPSPSPSTNKPFSVGPVKMKRFFLSPNFPFPSSSSSPSSSYSNNNNNDINNNSSSTGMMMTSAGLQQQRPSRLCPFYKKIPGTTFTVDAFRYGHINACSAYFLTHFHADHYGGLTRLWSHGPIYCTPLTARLVTLSLNVNPSFIRPMEFDTEYVMDGIKVTMLEANHCPGAALIHFRLPNGQCYLHTGDFRASKHMQTYPLLTAHRINVLYLDTTYCNPKYRFPPKEAVLDFIVSVTKRFMDKQPKTLVVVGAYSIGKECVYLEIAKALGVKIHANPWRSRILKCFDLPEISENLCSNGMDTPLHVLPISSLRIETLQRHLRTYGSCYQAILAFRPTGWTYSDTIGTHLDLIKPISRGVITIYGVPYSEHSSFTELREFVQFLRPEKIIPTVNVGDAETRNKMQSYFREWLNGR